MKGLQVNPMRMNSDALGTLAADTVVSLRADTGLTRSFLVKRVLYNLSLVGAVTDSVIIGLANGTATVAEIASAIRDFISDPDDATAPGQAALHWIIWWETIRMIGGTANAGSAIMNEEISVGGGKGIPALEDTGLQVFAYNPGTAALADSAVIEGLVTLQGVWLND